jgi:hypothetical protein
MASLHIQSVARSGLTRVKNFKMLNLFGEIEQEALIFRVVFGFRVTLPTPKGGGFYSTHEPTRALR